MVSLPLICRFAKTVKTYGVPFACAMGAFYSILFFLFKRIHNILKEHTEPKPCCRNSEHLKRCSVKLESRKDSNKMRLLHDQAVVKQTDVSMAYDGLAIFKINNDVNLRSVILSNYPKWWSQQLLKEVPNYFLLFIAKH